MKLGPCTSDVLPITLYCRSATGINVGPLLFLFSISDRPLYVKHTNIEIFANDATLHIQDSYAHCI